MPHSVLRIARRELAAFFGSPVAYIFLGAFLAATLFRFFWMETFFARNIADARPLFDGLPVLLIFLVAALTMRMWSEERRTGTLEYLLTLPVAPLRLVAGKLLACLALLAVALLLTVPLPITVALLGRLDWGPVVGGYLAALCLGAAYIAIGLYLSARSDNQIVSLIGTVLACGLFYLLGCDLFTAFFGNRAGELLKLLGSGSRFESITRGVIDLRDLYFYLSVTGVFGLLTVQALEKLRWAKGAETAGRRRQGLVVLLIAANLLAGNLWLQGMGAARLDLTEGHIYSVSTATRRQLAQLREPLLIRGYFSARTHPLLAPLVPRLRDLMREYQVAGKGRVRAEFVDPQQDPQLEEEANQKYGIKPVPFQVASRYQTSVVNSYFNVLVQYGDQYQVLDFQDLIDVKQKGGGAPEVELRNPEYELTRSIKKVQAGFQGGGDLLASLPRPVTLTGYLSADARLPDFLRTFKGVVTKVAGELRERSDDKLAVELVDPDADGGALAARLEADYGLRPMQAGLLDARRFWFYLTLADGETTVQVPLPEDLDEAGLRRNLEAGLKRFTSGYLKTVALAVPAAPDNPYLARMGMNDGPRFELLRQYLESGYKIKQTDLAAGMVPEEADILLVAAPQQLTDKALFAMDQFLMKGGTVVLATAPFKVALGRDLSATPQDAGLTDWLAHFGLTVEQRMVFDERNRPFPVPVNRQVGGFTLQEIQLVPYACFLDVRDDGLNPQLPVTAGLSQVLFNWAAPVQVDDGVRQAQKVTWLLKSSPAAWTADGTGIVPDFNLYGRLGFARGDDAGEKLLAVAVQGRFDSWFKGKPSPLLNGDDEQGTKGTKTPQLVTVIDRSPDSARLVLFASNDFISDRALQLSAAVAGHQDLSALQLVANTLDWALEDGDLPAIRGRGRYARTLRPLERRAQLTWEYLNYGLAAGGLLLVFIAYRLMSRRTRQRYQQLLDEGGR